MQAFYYFWPDYFHQRNTEDGAAPVSNNSPALVATRLSPLLCAAFTACAVLGWLFHDLRHTGRALESDLLCVAAATFAAAAAVTAAGLLLIVLLISGAVVVDGPDRWVADSILTLVALVGLLVQAATWWRRLALRA